MQLRHPQQQGLWLRASRLMAAAALRSVFGRRVIVVAVLCAILAGTVPNPHAAAAAPGSATQQELSVTDVSSSFIVGRRGANAGRVNALAIDSIEAKADNSAYLNVWVHYDFMVGPGYSDAPSAGAMDLVVAAFKAHGVTLHVMAVTVVGPDLYPSAGYALIDGNGVGDFHVAAMGQGPDDGFSGYKFFGNPPGTTRPRWGDYGAAVPWGGMCGWPLSTSASRAISRPIRRPVSGAPTRGRQWPTGTPG